MEDCGDEWPTKKCKKFSKKGKCDKKKIWQKCMETCGRCENEEGKYFKKKIAV